MVNWCTDCRAYHKPGAHYPVYRVWCRDWGEGKIDGLLVRADSPCSAAERWAETVDDRGDYQIVGDGYVDSVVVLAPDGERHVFDLTAEPSVEYHAALREEE